MTTALTALFVAPLFAGVAVCGWVVWEYRRSMKRHTKR